MSPHLIHKIGSNCVTISVGSVSPYDLCMGCDIDAAMNCINDMRTNVSGTVPGSCMMNGFSETDNTKCCPTYIQLGTQYTPVLTTSAYPQGLDCLRAVGCSDSPLYTEIYEECYNICLPFYNYTKTDSNQLQETFSRCTGLFNAAPSSNLNSLFVLIITIFSTVFMQLI